MSNPYLAAALAEQQAKRKTRTKKTSGGTPAKAATSAEKSDTAPSKEN